MIKNVNRAILAIFTIAALLCIVTACSSKQTKTEPPGNVIKNELEGAPSWVTKVCSVYWKDKSKSKGKVCGVGSTGGTRNIGMARSAAVGRGRTEIARSLKVKVKSMLKDYQATVTGGENFGKAAADEQYVVDASKQITDTTLSGSEMVDSWISNSGTYYALVVLDLEKFKSLIKEMQQLDEGVRKYIEEKAEAAFDELEEEIDKEREAKQ